ncbi:MAG: ParB/RepB/Spo0J family partition protein [Bacteroidaceae bacterium]|nr:ParB/RepB/Spo0J family partition protein [Bacteroidaceae bacterium]
MAVKKKFNALGKGLDALISTDDVHTEGSSTINEIKLDLIDANPNQPRREFNQESLQELADSIKEIGIIQPITLRQMENGRYQIIAGERRWRASQLAGLATIPAYIRTADDENVMEMALIENIQRQDLNSVEIALAYQRLIDTYGLTQEKLSERVGKKRTTIANYLRLLKLPAPVQVALQNHEIDMGHARALLALDDPKLQIKLFRDTKIKGYSVRKVEELIKQINTNGGEKTVKADKTIPQNVLDICSNLSKSIGAKVTATYKKTGGGKISIPFSDLQQLQRIEQLLQQLGQ